MPFDVASDPDAPELAALEAELAATGSRLRAQRPADGPDGPDASFAAGLRNRLLAAYAGAADGDQPPEATDRTRRPRAGHWPVRLPTRHLAIVRRRCRRRRGRARILSGRRSRRRPTPGPRMPSASTSSGPADRAAGRRDGSAGGRRGPGRARRAGDPRARSQLVRLHGGADLRIEDLSVDHVRHRADRRPVVPSRDAARRRDVPGDDRIRHVVRARNGLRSRPRADTDGESRVELLGLQHAVEVAGPGLQRTVDQGEPLRC